MRSLYKSLCPSQCTLSALFFPLPYTKACHRLRAPPPNSSRHIPPTPPTKHPQLQACTLPIQSRTKESKFQVRAEGSTGGCAGPASTSYTPQVRAVTHWWSVAQVSGQSEVSIHGPVALLHEPCLLYLLTQPSGSPGCDTALMLPCCPGLSTLSSLAWLGSSTYLREHGWAGALAAGRVLPALQLWCLWLGTCTTQRK